VNPNIVEFDPSSDDAATRPDGQPVVQRYELRVFLQGASQPVTTADLGKPAPDSDGKIRVDFSTHLVAWPLANGTYEARVAALGATDSAVSDLSNVFTFATDPPCTFTLSSGSEVFGPAGGSASVTVTASGSSCAWTAASNSGWVTLNPADGTGNGAVGLTAAPNSGSARTATLTIGGRTCTVTQAAHSTPPAAPKNLRISIIGGQ
jgi:hypothetical protein